MKYPVITGLLYMLSLIGFAQSTPTKDSLKIEIPTTILDSKVTNDVIIPIVETDTVPVIDIKSEHWDTTVYNPYKNDLNKFPLQITFKDTTYASPIKKKKVITSRYGWRRGRPHQGIDIDLVTGDSVVSMLPGIVRFAKYSSGHGKTVVVRHFNGLETTYAHLSAYAVKPNDTVAKGQYIGKGGNTGRSTGSHLHLVVGYKGQYIHPEYLFTFDDDNAIRGDEVWITKKHTTARFHSAYRLSKLDLLLNEDEALAQQVPKLTYYVVKRGDTLSRISQRNNVSIASLRKTNKLNKSGLIKVGQKLMIVN
ncbi:M23 family metallopeptidase [Winogradskyella maritima]|uniref:Peptidoglycan DD-metalloendopeptidase family protein n=1 Tax=Winogradskyella maritima TaxID=1517766 RepID=A0ABV8AJW4_9FLAO|nr:M23 family metallopeptidase [Winogradskyella maritima]